MRMTTSKESPKPTHCPGTFMAERSLHFARTTGLPSASLKRGFSQDLRGEGGSAAARTTMRFTRWAPLETWGGGGVCS